LAVAPLPVHDERAVEGDQQTPLLEVGAVEHQQRRCGGGRIRWRDGDVPAPGGGAEESAGTGGQLRGSALAEQPRQERVEFGLAGDVRARLRGRGAAGPAAPPGPSCARGPVLDELAGAYTTERCV